MKLVCAWCNSLISERGDASEEVSHGICKDCASGMMSEPSGLIRTFLDQLDYPVILIDSENKMYLENQQFKDMLGKTSLEIEGKRPGEIFNCKHWRESGSCGSTPHCKDCIINKSVRETFQTGKSILDVEVSLVTVDGDKTSEVDIHISTQKVDNYVLMNFKDRIDQY